MVTQGAKPTMSGSNMPSREYQDIEVKLDDWLRGNSANHASPAPMRLSGKIISLAAPKGLDRHMANGPEHPPSSTLERKLVAVLSADVAEYSRLMAEDEEQTLRIFREH